MKKIWHKIVRKWSKLRLQSIRVFCFHQVSQTFDPTTMWECDWTQIDQFKCNILRLKEKYEFITLMDATDKLKHDIFRRKKYAVLTADDGWASLMNIIPWLVEQKIPITLFVNPAYLLGEEIREKGMDKLLTESELRDIYVTNLPYISIASHGWNHQLTIEQSAQEFASNVKKSKRYLSNIEGNIPYFAYPSGKRKTGQDEFLKKNGVIPVYCDGQKNYNFEGGIHREPIDGC